MTYTLPFNLKQKPMRKYFSGGSISFSVTNGDMFYRVHTTTRRGNQITKWSTVGHKITSKDQLDKLLSVKTLNEIHNLEVVN